MLRNTSRSHGGNLANDTLGTTDGDRATGGGDPDREPRKGESFLQKKSIKFS